MKRILAPVLALLLALPLGAAGAWNASGQPVPKSPGPISLRLPTAPDPDIGEPPLPLPELAPRLPSPLAGQPVLPAAQPGPSNADSPPKAVESARRASVSPRDGAPKEALDAAYDGAGESVAFRLRIRESGVYLQESDGRTGDDSNGRRLSPDLDPARIAAGLKAALPKPSSSRRLYITGVEMGRERDAAEAVRSALSRAGAEPGRFDVRVLSVPRPWARGFARALEDRLVYFLPSLRRDFQAPLRGEIVSDVISTLVLETPNAFYLLAALPRPDAWLVLGVHAALISGFTLFQRSITNWILRSGKAGLLAKQLLMSLPFVLNYNVLGHYTALSAYARRAGAAGLVSRLPGAAAQFGVTQGLTLLLQTFFYSRVVSGGFRKWAANQKSPERSSAARAWVGLLLIPWLWLDAIFLAQAGTVSRVLLKAGPFLLTAGHAALAGLIAAGVAATSFPRLLDATLDFYRKARARL